MVDFHVGVKLRFHYNIDYSLILLFSISCASSDLFIPNLITSTNNNYYLGVTMQKFAN